jgi:hypothetical protein
MKLVFVMQGHEVQVQLEIGGYLECYAGEGEVKCLPQSERNVPD